jgi:hypothetical protein
MLTDISRRFGLCDEGDTRHGPHRARGHRGSGARRLCQLRSRQAGSGPSCLSSREIKAADAECQSYGAKPDSDAYVQCRLAIDVRKANLEAAAQAARQQARTRP